MLSKFRSALSQRQWGILLAVFGFVGAVGPIVVDMAGASEYAGIGPLQRLILLFTVPLFFIGISLVTNSKRLAYGFMGLTLVVYVFYFWVYSHYAYRLFLFPFDYDQGEGFELMDTILFSRGELPYRSNDSYPFYSSNYPPVFHLFIVPLVWLFGPQYWTGRLMSYLGTLVTAWAIGYAVQREGQRWWVSWVVALAYLASNFVYHVGPLFRQHLFMVMFETVAVVLLVVVLQREEKEGKRWNFGVFGVMLLLLFAGYTKQLAYATVITVFLYLLWLDWKRALAWGVPFGAVVAGIFAWLTWATNGEWWTATVTANINEFIDGQAWALYTRWFTLHTVLAYLSAGFVVWLVVVGRRISKSEVRSAKYEGSNHFAPRTSHHTLYALWFIVTLINSYTGGKWGAGESYFVTTIASTCILSGLAINQWLTWADSTASRGWQLASWTLIPLLLLWQADKVFHMPTHTPALKAIAQGLGKETETWVAPQTSCSDDRPAQPIPFVDSAFTLVGRPPTVEDRNAGIQITQLIANAGDSAAFSEEAGFNLYLGRDVVTNPTQLLNLGNNNAVDTSEMIAMLNDKAFDSVVLRAQFYPGDVLQAIGTNYEQTHLVQMNGFVYCIMEKRGE